MIVQNIYSCGKWLRIRRILEDQARLATERKLSRAMCQNPKTSLSASGNNSHVRDQVVYLENAGKLSSSRSGHGRKMTICFYTLIWRVRQNTCGNSTRNCIVLMWESNTKNIVLYNYSLEGKLRRDNATPSKQSSQRAFLTGKLATNPPELVLDLLLDREDCFPTGLTLCNFMRPWSAMRHASLSDDSFLICINTSSRPSSTISSLRVKNKNNHKIIITKIFAFRSSFTWSLKF